MDALIFGILVTALVVGGAVIVEKVLNFLTQES